MSYSLFFKPNPQREDILGHLGLSPEDVGNFEDAYVCAGEIVIYTRNGSLSRKCRNGNVGECGDPGCIGCIMRFRLPGHQSFLRDKDDHLDSTYATIYFKVPWEAAETLMAMNTTTPWDPDARWRVRLVLRVLLAGLRRGRGVDDPFIID